MNIQHTSASLVVSIYFLDDPQLYHPSLLVRVILVEGYSCLSCSMSCLNILSQSVLSTTGVVESYVLNQGSLWWILNISAIYWKVQFPFHSRYYDKTNRTRYIHIVCVVAAIFLPIIAPVTIAIKGGFTTTRFPPIFCFGKNLDANFYALVLPNAVLYATGTTVLLLILWRIRKVATCHYIL